MKVKPWLGQHVSDESLNKIEAAVAAAESKTAGEIVPMIVRSSSPVGHTSLVLFLLFAVILFASNALTYLPHQLGYTWGLAVDVICVMTLGLLSIRLGDVAAIQRFVLTPVDQAHCVQVRAELEFYRAGLEKTDGSTGVLIFLSWLERRAVVLADKNIASKLPPATWDEVIKTLTSHLHQNEFEKGMVTAVEICGGILAEHFPRQQNDRNELSNRLIIKE